MTKDRTELGLDIEAGLREAIAHRRGDLALESRHVEVMPAARVKEIRKSVAKTTKEFERRFHIPARTVEGWEQGRKLGASDRVLLTVIAADPEAVERALAGETAGA
ncbi:transcriptional regulator [Phenylobacterium sp. 20VBR1]|uniref:Transcriptional regulator n=1 Tax=Phenylobacterium glaciei TaxID=2803784 RepID=A0A941HWZ8_9CAUL|nr:transcriptional regulator [Phenylobacterium glaciei]MBR7620373.1 transcriptional regulator [Phenylobacterium glaciei]